MNYLIQIEKENMFGDGGTVRNIGKMNNNEEFETEFGIITSGDHPENFEYKLLTEHDLRKILTAHYKNEN